MTHGFIGRVQEPLCGAWQERPQARLGLIRDDHEACHVGPRTCGAREVSGTRKAQRPLSRVKHGARAAPNFHLHLPDKPVPRPTPPSALPPQMAPLGRSLSLPQQARCRSEYAVLTDMSP